MLTLVKKDLPVQTIENTMPSLLKRLHLGADGDKMRIITFMAARSGEGVSTVANEYVQRLAAETNKKVLLIDAGLRQNELINPPSINMLKGLVETALSGGNINDAIYSINGNCFIARWAVVSANRNHTARVIAIEGFWQKLSDLFDAVVIDAPSFQVSFDGIMLATKSDGAVIILESEKTPKPVVRYLRDTLMKAGANVLGVVLNKRRYYIPKKIYKHL